MTTSKVFFFKVKRDALVDLLATDRSVDGYADCAITLAPNGGPAASLTVFTGEPVEEEDHVRPPFVGILDFKEEVWSVYPKE